VRLWLRHLPLPPVPLAGPGECDVCDLPHPTDGTHPACRCGMIGPHLVLKADHRRWRQHHRRLARVERDQRRGDDDFDQELLTW
jgi:hypothetical protein